MNYKDEMFIKMNEILNNIERGVDYQFFDKNMDFAKEVGNYYNSTNNQEDSKKCIEFLTNFFINYISSKYGVEVNYELSSKINNSFFRTSENKIYLSLNRFLNNRFDYILFTIFHEYKHKLQYNDMFRETDLEYTSVDKITQIDPSTFLFIKDRATHMTDSDNLYVNNHNCFFEENDANLFSIQECKNIIDASRLKKFISRIDESTDYVSMIVDGDELYTSKYKKEGENLLPITYEEDYRFKKVYSNKKIGNSILKLIFDENGRIKTYEDLLQDEKRLLEKYSNSSVKQLTSTTSYQEYSTRSIKDHIREIYRIIVHSDPILTLQKYFYIHNSIKSEIVSKKWEEKIYELLNNCPQIVDMYFEEIESLLVQQCSQGNTKIIENIINISPKLNTNLVKQTININKIMMKKTNKFKKVEKNNEVILSQNEDETLKRR